LKCLNLFLDKDGLLRIDGKLRYANLQYDIKHPLLLFYRSKLTELIIVYKHIKHFHAGAHASQISGGSTGLLAA